MRVVHISFDVNSCSANVRIQKAIQQSGIYSNILVKDMNYEIDNVIEMQKNIAYKIKGAVFDKIERNILEKKYPYREPVLFSPELYGLNVSNNDIVRNADIIHLHWVCGCYQSIHTVANIIKLGKPVVWTMHDSWAMTGGCHVRYGCMRFQKGCGKCPMLHSKAEHDLSYYVLKQKKALWKDNNIIIVTPSKWLLNDVRKSSLFKNNKSVCIPNPIDERLYGIKEKGSKNRFAVLFGASGVTLPYKGFSYFERIMLRLKKEKPAIAEQIIIYIFGTENLQTKLVSEYDCRFCGYIRSEKKMAEIYQMSDIYVFPSTDDNLPGTVMESMSCGTPVLAFETGGIPDMVEHKKNGYLAKYKDEEDLYNGFLWIYNNNADNNLGIYARKKIEKEFSMMIIGEKYKALYNALL